MTSGSGVDGPLPAGKNSVAGRSPPMVRSSRRSPANGLTTGAGAGAGAAGAGGGVFPLPQPESSNAETAATAMVRRTRLVIRIESRSEAVPFRNGSEAPTARGPGTVRRQRRVRVPAAGPAPVIPFNERPG